MTYAITDVPPLSLIEITLDCFRQITDDLKTNIDLGFFSSSWHLDIGFCLFWAFFFRRRVIGSPGWESADASIVPCRRNDVDTTSQCWLLLDCGA